MDYDADGLTTAEEFAERLEALIMQASKGGLTREVIAAGLEAAAAALREAFH